jgi:hypothetical protein
VTSTAQKPQATHHHQKPSLAASRWKSLVHTAGDVCCCSRALVRRQPSCIALVSGWIQEPANRVFACQVFSHRCMYCKMHKQLLLPNSSYSCIARCIQSVPTLLRLLLRLPCCHRLQARLAWQAACSPQWQPASVTCDAQANTLPHAGSQNHDSACGHCSAASSHGQRQVTQPMR